MEDYNGWYLVLTADCQDNDSARPSQLQGRNLHPPSNDDGNGHGDHEQPAEIESGYDAANKKAPTVQTATTSNETATSEHTAQPPVAKKPAAHDQVICEHCLRVGPTEDLLAQLQRALEKERAADMRWWFEDVDVARGGSHSQPSGSGATRGSSAKKSTIFSDGAAAHDDFYGTGSQFPNGYDRPMHMSDI